jgi:dCTP deaminase
MLKQSQIAARLNPSAENFEKDPFFFVPSPKALSQSGSPSGNGAASLDLHLGTWFLTSRHTQIAMLEVGKPSVIERRLNTAGREMSLDESLIENLKLRLNPPIREGQLVTSYHVRFGEDFILHPRSFVLGVTLEWMRLPSNLGGYVTGKSSWGRRGLIIATATGVHPGFTGCLTLELSNLGDIPIAIRPGLAIGQLFLHDVISADASFAVDGSSFVCKRQPKLGHPKTDDTARKLFGVEL